MEVEDSDDELLGLVKTESLSPRSTSSTTSPPLPRHRRYLKFPSTSHIRGYVVQVHDATNFDIDLNFNSSLESRYSQVVNNDYSYKCTNDPRWLKIPDQVTLLERSGRAYRCRLRGVGLNSAFPYAAHSRRALEIKEEIRRLFDRTDGWCTCVVSDVDVYSRLLVDVILWIGGKSVKLKEHLLQMMSDPDWRDLPIYCQYNK